MNSGSNYQEAAGICLACGACPDAEYRFSLSWSIWLIASAMAASGSDHAKPTSSVENKTPSITTGFRSARDILACHKPLPASKDSILKPSWSHCMAQLRADGTNKHGSAKA